MGKYTWQFISKMTEPTVHRIVWDTPETVPPGSHCGPEVRSLFLIECNVSGYGKVTVNGKCFNVVPRCCYVLFPGDEVLLEADKEDPRQAIWCTFGGARIEEIFKSIGINSTSPFVPSEKFDEILAIMEKMHTSKGKSDMGAELFRTACIYEFLSVLTRGRTDISKNIIAERAKNIMESEYYRDISVSDIANELGFERSYFSVLFKASTGKSPYAYLLHIRLKKACDMLKNTHLSMSEISERVGLDPHNFSRIFSREIGVTPMEYKKKDDF